MEAKYFSILSSHFAVFRPKKNEKIKIDGKLAICNSTENQ